MTGLVNYTFTITSNGRFAEFIGDLEQIPVIKRDLEDAGVRFGSSNGNRLLVPVSETKSLADMGFSVAPGRLRSPASWAR